MLNQTELKKLDLEIASALVAILARKENVAKGVRILGSYVTAEPNSDGGGMTYIINYRMFVPKNVTDKTT